MDEYGQLRNEIIEDYRTITQYNSVLYTVVAAILVFGLKENSYYLCLVSYVAILPLYLLCEAKRKDICRLASYMAVFGEGNDYKWELRHQKFEKNFKSKRNWQSIFPYYFAGFICSIISIYKITLDIDNFPENWFRIVLVSLLTIIMFIFMKCKSINYVEEKQ